MKKKLRWKMTFVGWWTLLEDHLWWKTTFDGRRPLMEDNIWWKTTFDGRRPLMEEDLWWKITLDGRWHLMEDDLCWKTTFVGRRCLMVCTYVFWKKFSLIIFCTESCLQFSSNWNVSEIKEIVQTNFFVPFQIFKTFFRLLIFPDSTKFIF